MPPKRSHEANDDKAEGQRAKTIRIANPNSNDIEGHEAIGGEDDGQGLKVIQFVSPSSENAGLTSYSISKVLDPYLDQYSLRPAVFKIVGGW